MSQDDDVERVARAILRVRVQGFNLGWDDSGGRSVIEYGREMARAALSAMPPRDELLREALEWIVKHYANQDMSHMDFRVEAYARALEALEGAPTQEHQT